MLTAISHVQQKGLFYPLDSDLFSDEIYLSELRFILPLALVRCPDLLPLRQVLHALFSVEHGSDLIQSLMMNLPSERHEILRLLFDCCSSIESVSSEEKLSSILLSLSHLSRSNALWIRSSLVDRHLLPGLVLRLTLHVLRDEVSFLTGLLGENLWMREYIKDQQSVKSSSPVAEMRKVLLERLQEYGNHAEDSLVQIQLSVLLRLYCGLIGMMGLSLGLDEMMGIMEVLARSTHERVSKLGLCWLLTCEGLVKACGSSTDPIVKCISTMMKLSGHCLEILLLLSIHFHTNQLPKIVDFVRSVLGLPVSIHGESLNQIGQLFREQLFTEEV